MKVRLFLISAFMFSSLMAVAQNTNDPVIMKINGTPVLRSEYEYSFRKNNSEGVIDKKSVKEYVDLFVNYKLKVLAALDAHLDTMQSYQQEFAKYRDMQIRPAMITDADVEAEAQRIYKEAQERIDGNGGLVKPAHILLMVKQGATDAEAETIKLRADSIYNVLKVADFDETLFGQLATQYSEDPGSAKQEGVLPWLQKGQTLPEFDSAIFSMQKGGTSLPVKTVAGYHIIQLRDKGNFFSYESQRNDIISFIDQRGLREKIIDQKIDELAKATDSTPEKVLADKRNEMVAADQDLAYLIQEYHDGLLIYEISNKHVWEKAAKDEKGLEKFFKKNKKKYQWDEPRFKGIAYRTKEASDIEAVKKCLKGLKYDEWNERLRSTFNNDSVLRIRAEKGVFKKGDNGLVDRDQFGVADAKIKEQKGYPNMSTYGKMLSAPESYKDVRSLVVADYQEQLEKEWVAILRKKYTFEVDESVLETVK